MLRINIKNQDSLLEGDTYQEIFQELHNRSYCPEEDLRTFVGIYLKRLQKLVDKDVSTSFSSYEDVVNELIRVGIFEKVD
jgi:hypothetical protein